MENFDMKKLVKVTNRCGGMAIYKIPEHGIRREFIAGESKMIPYEELVWLSYQPGGRNMMSNTFLIEEVKATQELNIHTEPEYFMTEADVINMLQNGSVDELKDALDFAPTGVVQIIKDQAVALPVYDTRKRQAILEMTERQRTLTRFCRRLTQRQTFQRPLIHIFRQTMMIALL